MRQRVPGNGQLHRHSLLYSLRARSVPVRRPVRPGNAALCAVASVLIWALTSCSGAASSAGEFKPIPDKLTSATLAGPLCKAQICSCVGDGSDPGLPEAADVKRYQFKLGPTDNELWVMVDDMVMYKTVERASECFIVDLGVGKHEVVLRAKSETGFGARLTINEIGKHGPYQTFDFQCGAPGSCTFDQLDSFKASLTKYKRQIHDPCGSTKIRAPNWLTAASPDRIHPGDMQLKLVMQIYDFSPGHPSGHPECKDRF